MATFVKIDTWAGVAMLAAAVLLIWAFGFPESFASFVDAVAGAMP